MNVYDRPRQFLAAGLATLAGFADATGFLAAKSYFVSFMSGNTTRLAVDIVTDRQAAILPALLIAGFVAGVTGGALLADRAGTRRKSAVLSAAAVLLVLAAMLQTGQRTGGFLACTVLSMGVINNSFRRNGEVAIGVTYMTGALVRFGQGLAAFLQGSARPGWLGNLALWAGLVCGAVAGTAAFLHSQALSAWIAAGWAMCLAASAVLIERRGHPSS